MTGSGLRAVIFDCDGVIADSEPLHLRAFQAVLAPLGIVLTPSEYQEQYLGSDDRDVFTQALRRQGVTPTPAQVGGLIDEKARRLQLLLAESTRIYPGVSALVHSLADMPLAVASGALRDEIETLLRQAGIRDAFRVIVAAEDVRAGKPDPEGFLLALALLQQTAGPIAPGACLVVEDSLAGVEAARRAGMRCLAVTNSYPAAALGAADLVVASLEAVDRRRLHALFG